MTQTTPTRDEAVPAGYMRPADKDGNSFWCSRQKSAYYTDPVFASAPAPASGGVDAVIRKRIARTIWKFERCPDNNMTEAQQDFDWRRMRTHYEECADLVLASLSLAATPVSEAEPVDEQAFCCDEVIDNCASEIAGLVGPNDEAQAVEGAVKRALLMMRGLCNLRLGKPASSPAGGDVVARLLWNRWHARHGGDYDGAEGTLARADTDSLAKQIIATLSQSISGGRVGE